MLSKSELKKRFILKKAKQVFIEKGYKIVTMTDIVEACEISRGGLYMYYKNTSEIFFEMLYIEQEETGYGFSEAINTGVPAVVILESFFQQQKEDLLNKDKSLTIAIYEFFSINRGNFKEDILKQQFESAVKIVADLIHYGMDRNEFKLVDKNIVARNIILLLEGIRVSSEVMKIREDLIEEQLNYIKSLLLSKDIRK
jgi:AcrR family transcriptional regulator